MLKFLGLKKSRKRKTKTISTWKVLALIVLALSLIVTSTIFVWVASLEIPSLDGFEARQVTQSTKIYDRTGKVLLFDLHDDIRRTVIPLEEVARYAKNAAVAIEDAEFYEHRGIKPKSILRAVFANIRSGSYSQGGSTITQQIVKNALLTRKKTITRKVKEWILAIKLDARMTKEEILEIYLNDSPYGGTIYGIEEASQYFFGVSANELTIPQAAYLAALPQRPTYFSPYGKHRDALETRKNLVLLKMREKGFINEQEYRDALNETVEFTEYGEQNIKAPHFVFYVRDYLEKKYGRDAVYENGLKVISTLDYRLQKKAEKILKEYALANEKKFRAENSAMVAIDPHTGQILAMVGSRDYFDENIDGKFNVTTALRQPGSTFKPIVYSLAFEKGYTPSTILFDLPTQFSTSCQVDNTTMTDGCYSPKNYDNKFRGPMTMANALAQSINIPAVKTLYLAGVADSIAHARKMGITSLTRSAAHYGFSLVLGGGEVTLLELTNLYGAFANDGIANKHTSILKVQDPAGTVLEEYERASERVLSTNSARNISNILSNNASRAPAYGSRSPLFFNDRQVAAKTGTTNNFRDVWIIGFTPDIVVGTWAGNNDNTPIVNEFAGFVLAPMWRAIMSEALELVPNTNFKSPTNTATTTKAVLNGQWQGPSASVQSVHSILHWVNKSNPTGTFPINPATNPQYKFWEYPVQKWAKDSDLTSTTTPTNIPNTNTEPNSTGPVIRYMHISSPANGARVRNNMMLTTQLNYTPATALTKVEYYLDGVFVGAATRSPFSISVVPHNKGSHSIKAIGRAGFIGTYVDETHFFVD